MPDKVFYSWQSDRPNKTNRGFIEDALVQAIRNLGREENEIYVPSRDLELDKDTKGIPGSPPVADTIFRKIEECAVFVPDLTFCGLTEEKRPIPNANVLIEYGWALAKPGHERIVAVMNEAYGRATETSLPFNIRHTRWPHRFTLREDAEPDERNSVKRGLTKHFEDAIRTALAASPAAGSSSAPLQPNSGMSSFLKEGDVLGILPRAVGRLEPTPVVWRDGPRAFLRVVPGVPVGPYSALQIHGMLDNTPLTPFWSPGRGQHWRIGNEWGAVVFESGGSERVAADYIVQITSQGEIWGIDNFWLQARRIDFEAEELRRLDYPDMRPQDHVVRFFEDAFALALSEYLRFAKEQLEVTSPVTVIAGFTGIQGFQTYLPPPRPGAETHHRVGGAAKPNIVSIIRGVSLEPEHSPELQFNEDYVLRNDAYFRHAYKELIPFFVEAWNEFQHPRPVSLPKLNTTDGADGG
ncbi:MAG: hypothetical protein OYH76_24705 [Defluviicoccus sp.]|nr:hypothetical protein [Defluviicoccus sp.]MDE0279109.1 hypothetical protein [Defluviicoccus sp.]